MATLMLWSSFILLFLPHMISTSTNDCGSLTCGGVNKFEIRFPFRLKNRQPDHCGYPEFDLSCTKSNETILELPFSRNFFVRNINYTNQEIEIYDSTDCLPGKILDFNLSGSPFKGKQFGRYSFFNCSMDLSDYWFRKITCPHNYAYDICYISSDASFSSLPPGNYTILRTVSVPLKYEFGIQMNLENDSTLSLTWDKPNCRKCESWGGKCGFKNYGRRTIGCFRIPPSDHRKGALERNIAIGALKRNIAIGVSIGVFVFMVATVTVIRARKQTGTEEKENQLKIEKFLETYKALKPTRYSYADIKRMTKKFNKKLGQGGYGSVFEGKLTNGIPVAVKILNDSKGNGEEFINEVGTMGRIHHVNVVRLLGFCADGFRRALVYEFMPNESLEKFIFSGKNNNPHLGWKKLQDIAISIARGIEYLHQGCDLRILHFDIKPHNILLDHNFNPKISDFGLAKLCSKGESNVLINAARGTMGYIAPEVFCRNFGNVSYKSDIYSFGMLLLEMVGGRKNIEVQVQQPSQVYFPEWIYYRIDKGEDLGIQVDTEEDALIVKKLTMVALWCIQWHPVDRPSIKTVVQMLEGDTVNMIMPPNPFASTAPATTMPEQPQNTELTVFLEESE